MLDLIHCDLWGLAPIISTSGYSYYVIFVDDFSCFTWFYPLKAKSDFHTILDAFLKLVQTQFSCKVKEFQSDGGIEFTNHRVSNIFLQNGTHHRYSCPYTPQQNGRAEPKHRYVTETGLAMLFNAHAPLLIGLMLLALLSMSLINFLPNFLTTKVHLSFSIRTHLILMYLEHLAVPHKLAPRSMACIFIGYCTQY